MNAPRSVAPSDADDDEIARGDQLARQGEWSEALTAWRSALEGPQAARASERIGWFLVETGSAPERTVAASTRGIAHRALVAAVVAACLGTAVTILGSGRSGTEAMIVAIAAWLSFAASIGLTLLFSRKLAAPPPLLSDAEAFSVAMTRAAIVEHEEINRKAASRSAPVRE